MYYISPRVRKWSSIELPAPMHFTDAKEESGAIGFMLVYESYEEFKAAFPDDEPVLARDK